MAIRTLTKGSRPVTYSGQGSGASTSSSTSSYNPYNYFTSNTSPSTGAAASSLGSSLMGGYNQYKQKSVSDYVPQDVLSQLGQYSQSFQNYTPETVTKPLEYYTSQIEDLSKPLTAQYDKSRAAARGDQAARGTLYDSQGYQDIGEIDKSYLDQLGSVTRGVAQQRMQDQYQEGSDRRALSLDAMKSGAALATDTFGKYSQAGGDESARYLQGLGLDANTINSILGYSADTYGTKGNLFGDLYSSTDPNKVEQDRRQSMIDLLGLQGYTDNPQTQAWNNLYNDLKGSGNGTRIMA